jgi:hypothetical protein
MNKPINIIISIIFIFNFINFTPKIIISRFQSNPYSHSPLLPHGNCLIQNSDPAQKKSKMHTAGILSLSDVKDTITDVKNAIMEIKASIDGLLKFINTISDTIKTMSSIIGFKAIILLASVIVFSFILSFFGIPRGNTSFIISLILSDAIWYTWARSFNPESYNFIKSIIYANMILLSPIILISLMKKFLPVLFNKFMTFAALKMRLPIFKNMIYNKDYIINFIENFQTSRAEFEKSILKDLINSKDKNSNIILSSITLEQIENMRKIINNLYKLNKTNFND